MGGGYTITIPQDVPTSSITQDGETLYFQGWMQNGIVSTIYTPNEEVEVETNDVFTPYYAKDASYPEFTFTVDSVTGEYILSGANKNITSATIPALYKGQVVSVIKNQAFALYKSLQTVEIPQTITKIGNNAFEGCSNLTEITIPNSVTSMGDYAFYTCSSLAEITIPKSVTGVGTHAFYHCDNLTSITISEGVTTIGSSAFHGCCKLTSITIPKSVTSIGEQVFVECLSLTEIIVDNDNPNYCSVAGVLFDKKIETLIAYPCDASSLDYTIPKSVTLVKASAFSWAQNLQNIFVETGNTEFSSIDGVLFNKSATTICQYPIARTATSYTIPEGCVTSTMYVFCGNEYLKTIVFPSTFKTIQHTMCHGMCALESIVIPASVSKIAISVFESYYCKNLITVTFENTTGWYATDSSSYSGGDAIDVTNPTTNATNLKSNSSWCTKYLYRK